MSEQVTVEALKDARDWNSPDGKIALTFYTLDIVKADGTSEEVDHGRKQGGSEPQPGEVLDVIFEEGKFRRKMKKAPNANFSSSGSADYAPRSNGKSPDQQASIQRQVALKILAPSINADGLTEKVKATVREIEAFINESGAVSAPPPAAPSQTDTQGTHERLSSLLEGAGQDSVAARAITDFVLTELGAEEQDAAIDRLSKDNFKAGAVTRLKERYTEVNGEPVPVGVDESESIPF